MFPALDSTLTARNAFFDSLFYDVGALSPEETRALGPILDQESALIAVSPRGSDHGIRRYSDVQGFLAAEPAVRAVVVAGVGSSAIGTAALARNVADAYGVPVAGVVSGYGIADIMTEAAGGWFPCVTPYAPC